MQSSLPMFESERWLARLAFSPHQSRFVLEGGVLLVALGNRRRAAMPFTLASVRSARSPRRSDPLEPVGQSRDRHRLDP